MAKPSIEWRVDKFAKLGLFMHAAASEGVRSLAAGVLYHAMENIQINGSVDTGAMRASMYMQAGEGASPRREAIAAAKKRNVEAAIADSEWEPQNDMEAKVACGVEYGTYVEMGTRRSAAKPFLGPAFDLVNSQKDDVLAKIVKEYLGKL